MNLILNRAGFRTNHEPNMVHGMVHGKCQINSKAQIVTQGFSLDDDQP